MQHHIDRAGHKNMAWTPEGLRGVIPCTRATRDAHASPCSSGSGGRAAFYISVQVALDLVQSVVGEEKLVSLTRQSASSCLRPSRFLMGDS